MSKPNEVGLRTYELEDGIKYTEGDIWFQNVPLQDPDGNITFSTGKSVMNHGGCVYAVEIFPDDSGARETLLESRCFHNIDSSLREQLEDLK